MDMRFDLDHVIRKAGLRRHGITGLASLVESLRANGHPADILKRAARMEAKSRLDGAVIYVKEQEQMALRLDGKMTTLHMDTDWQEALERFHRNLAWRGTPGRPLSTVTLNSYYMEHAMPMEDNELYKHVDRGLVRTIQALLDTSWGDTPLARRHTPWRATKGLEDVSDGPKPDTAGTQYPDNESLADLRDLEKGGRSAIPTLEMALGYMKESGIAISRTFVGLGTYEKPRVIEGFRFAIACPDTGRQLVIGDEGSWGGMAASERDTLGELRFFLGQDTTLALTGHSNTKPDSPWTLTVKRFALDQVATRHGPARTATAKTRKI